MINNRITLYKPTKRAFHAGRIVVSAALSSFMLLAPIALVAGEDATKVAEYKAEARALLERDEYEAALAVFEKAFDASPSPLLMFNIAMCEKALSRHVEALEAFRLFFDLQAAAKTNKPKLTAMAKRALHELHDLVGAVEIIDAPDGASVSVDGRAEGDTPLKKPLYLMPGKHTVVVAKAGLEPMEIDIVVAGGATLSVRADLEQPTSRIEVTCDDPDSLVTIDGRELGPCPCAADVPPGRYELKISAPDKKTVVQEVRAETRRTTLISVNLKPTLDITDMPVPQPVRPFDSGEKDKWILSTGISAVAIGIAGLGVGAFLGVKYNQQVDAANDELEIVDKYNSDPETITNDDKYATYSAAYDAYEDNKDSSNDFKRGFIISYALGGAFLSVGIGIISHYLLTEKGDNRDVVSFGPGGVDVSF